MQNHDVDLSLRGPLIALPNAVGLHARPAAVFVQAAKKFKAQVSLCKSDLTVNGKSVVAIMGLETKQGDALSVMAKGDDAQEAIQVLSALLQSGCGEAHANASIDTDKQKIGTPEHHATEMVTDVPEGAFIGISASPGIALGQVFQFERYVLQFSENSVAGAAHELANWQQALNKVRTDLEAQSALKSDSLLPVQDASTEIMAAHLTILEDPELLFEVSQTIEKGKSAAFACQYVFEKQAQKLESSSQSYLRSRAVDLRDIGRRLVRAVLGMAQHQLDIPSESIVMADDLSPSETVQLDRSKIVGLVTVQGGPSSHVAILAKSFGIPLLCGASPNVLKLPSGTSVLLNANQAWLLVNPDADRLAQAKIQILLEQNRHLQHLASAHSEAITQDGCRIEVVANIRNESDAQQAIQLGAEGVGLLRSEFLFTDRSAPPTEVAQSEAYLAVARVLGPRRTFVIRTLDVGGDKPLSYLPLPSEENPFLGIRGIRVSLLHPDLFRAQLRAILRVASASHLHIMFPMVSDLGELLEAKRILSEEKSLLAVNHVSVGVMIEVPSAALMVDHLAAEVDFFSIGTNDLTQYTLAMDRGHPQLGQKANPLHPAVLKMIDMTCVGAQKHGKWVGVCGGLAGQELAVPLLVGLGVRELSVDVPSIPSVKARVRQYNLSACQALAKEVLNLPSAQAVTLRLQQFQTEN